MFTIAAILTTSILGSNTVSHVPSVHSVEVQCNLLAAPPLKKLPKALSVVLDQSFTSDPEDTDMGETDLDSLFQITQDDTTTE